MGPVLAALTPAEREGARIEGQSLPLEEIVASTVKLAPDDDDGSAFAAAQNLA